ncbi:MAG: M48 family metallopeptidase [Candidatus Obscuribacterales bacterium]|nr:M48 family metallopeptidase [Candidatus Obscuribacterales bacterium]
MTAAQQTPADIAEAKKYARETRRLTLLKLAANLIFLSFMAFAGGAWLDTYIEPLTTGNRWLHLAVFALVLMVLQTVLFAPLTFFTQYIHEHRYGLSNQTVGSWLWQQSKMQLLGGGFSLLCVFALYAALWYAPGFWWLVAGLVLLFASVVIGQIFPFLVPLFYKLEPISKKELVESFRRLAAGTGIKIEAVLSLGMSKDTKKANAMLTGLGASKRVMLGDTLLQEFPQDEIEVVFAHELGHSVHKHMLKSIIFSTVSILGGLFLCNLAIQAWYPLGGHTAFDAVSSLTLISFVLAVFGQLTGPVGLAISRHHERQADSFALETTNAPASFKRAFERLAKSNKADGDPPRWWVILFCSHPPIKERLAMAEVWSRSR